MSRDSNAFPFMRFYGRDWYESEAVNAMSPAAEGIYLRLCWRVFSEGSIPADPAAIALLTKYAGNADAFLDVWKEISGSFSPLKGTPQRLIQPRALAERKTAEKKSQLASGAADTRWSKRNANALRPQCQQEHEHEHEQEHEQGAGKKKIAAPGGAAPKLPQAKVTTAAWEIASALTTPALPFRKIFGRSLKHSATGGLREVAAMLALRAARENGRVKNPAALFVALCGPDVPSDAILESAKAYLDLAPAPIAGERFGEAVRI